MTTFSSRDRFLAALNHVEPDRVPINYAANPEIDLRLKAHYGLAPTDGEGLARTLGVDFRGVWVRYVGPKLHDDLPDRQVDIWGVRTRWVEHGSGGYWDFCDFPLADATLEEVERWPMPDPDDFDYSTIAETCRRYDEFAISVGGAGVACVINRGSKLRSMEQLLVDLATDDPAGLRLIERKQDIELEIARRAIEAGNGRFDFLMMGEDLGSQIGPMISLPLYRKHIRPQHEKFTNLARTHDLAVMVHTCGSSSWVYDDFIEMGVSAVETLQPEARDMSPEYLKGRFGDRLAFHGCLSTAGALTWGTPDDVVRDTRQTLETMMPGGGYFAAPTHQIQDNTPTENVIAMYDAIHKYGKYT